MIGTILISFVAGAVVTVLVLRNNPGFWSKIKK